MDPFSVTVGAVALAETANRLASSLTDRYRAFHSAPKEMLEVASQVTMCAGLVDVFARSIDLSNQEFPKRFQDDASTLVKQCRAILKDIDEMIPHGSKKSDYAERLKYAFGNQKKLAKHQENLRQVQHMFMFMATCWQYQLPSKKPATATSAVPLGSLQGTMQHIPLQINMSNPGTNTQKISYEATLTLKPLEHVTLGFAGKDESLRSAGTRRFKTSSRERQSLENMRRSPYFSMKLLQPTVTDTKRYHRMAAEFASKEGEEMRIEIGEGEMRKGREELEIKPPSREQAAEEVDNILSQWFDDDHDLDIRDSDSLLDSEEVTVEEHAAPLRTKGGLHIEDPQRPKSAPVPEPHDWDWACDGCDNKFFYHETRYKCRECSNFDFCPACYGVVWHRHGTSSFIERNV